MIPPLPPPPSRRAGSDPLDDLGNKLKSARTVAAALFEESVALQHLIDDVLLDYGSVCSDHDSCSCSMARLSRFFRVDDEDDQ